MIGERFDSGICERIGERFDGGINEKFVCGISERFDGVIGERIRGAQMARLQSPDPTQRFEGLTAKIEDWHSLQAYYQVSNISNYQ